MPIKRLGLFALCALFIHAVGYAQAERAGYAQAERKIWLSYMDKVARPVLSALAEDRLHETMPVALSRRIDNGESRSKVTYLEAWGRLLSGIGPWLNSEAGGFGLRRGRR